MLQIKHRKDSYLFTKPIIPQKAKFPVIDAHNHLWGAWNKIPDIVKIMNDCGIAMYSDLTANVELKWVKGGYAFKETDINHFFQKVTTHYPSRFYGFTTATFTRPTNKPLLSLIHI